MGMAESIFEKLDLSPDLIENPLLLEFLFLQDFDSNLLASDLVQGL